MFPLRCYWTLAFVLKQPFKVAAWQIMERRARDNIIIFKSLERGTDIHIHGISEEEEMRAPLKKDRSDERDKVCNPLHLVLTAPSLE